MPSLILPTVNIGIAIYNQFDKHGHPLAPLWSIVAHEDEYFSDDPHGAHLYQIVFDHKTSRWCLHYKIRSLARSTSLLGVVHVARVPYTMKEVQKFADGFKADKDENDFSGLVCWGCEAWCVRFLWALRQFGGVRLSCPVEKIYRHVGENCLPVLRRLKEGNGGRPAVVPM